jgi:hypothetical protein
MLSLVQGLFVMKAGERVVYETPAAKKAWRGILPFGWVGRIHDAISLRLRVNEACQDIDPNLSSNAATRNMATPQAVRRWILTGAVAAITMTGTIYGATLKGEREVVRVSQDS